VNSESPAPKAVEERNDKMSQQLIAGLTFFAVVTAIYTLMHWPVYYCAVRTFSLPGWGRLVLGLWFVLLILGPTLLNLTGRQAGFMSQIVYVWMGLIFYLSLGSVDLIIIRLIWGLTPLRLGFVILLAFSLVAVGHGWLNARQVRVRNVVMETNKLPAGTDILKIAVISDLHLGSVEMGGRLERTLEKLKSLDYDLLLSLGDLIEVGLDHRDWPPLAQGLAEVKPRLGKYAVTGNHEYYTGRYGTPEFTDEFHRRAGFVLLRQEAEVVAGTVQLVGMDDPSYGLTRAQAGAIELNLLQQLDPALPTLLLKHQPRVAPTSLGLFDLQLSGHTHAGQMWPFNYLVALVFGQTRGLHELPSGSRLYISQGTGTWGPPVRVGTESELTLIRLLRSQ
jgi:predicted MPP superfamily phosphohydrolase